MKSTPLEHLCLMAGLAPREAEVLLLARDGLSYPAIAERLGVSLAAVRCAATRARRKLREEEERLAREADLLDLVGVR